MLIAETDQTAEIAVYESLGFVRADGQDSVTAHVLLQESVWKGYGVYDTTGSKRRS
jgi:hypothetical protein